MGRRRNKPHFPHETGFSPNFRGRVPHSTPTEQTMLFAWLDMAEPRPYQLWYDVHFDGVPGDQPPLVKFPVGTPANMERMWQRLNAKRADAVARYPQGYKLVELRPRAGAQTIGEIHQYRYLAASEWPSLTWLKPLVITMTVDPMVQATIIASDIDLIVLPHDAVPQYWNDPVKEQQT